LLIEGSGARRESLACPQTLPFFQHAPGDQKRKAPKNQAARGERLHFCRIGPKPITTVLSSRLVALSRCPDADSFYMRQRSDGNGPKVSESNQSNPVRTGLHSLNTRCTNGKAISLGEIEGEYPLK
jgi:hypothetical protein